MNKRTRGFTLLEMMVVVAVLGIMATIAMPDLTPAIHKARIRGQTDEVTNFVERARRQARAEGRCYRISKAGTGGLIMEERTDADCFTGAPRINAGWNTVATLALTAPGFTLSIENLNGGTVDDRLIFRPNGRLRGDADFDTTDEGARIVVRYAPVPNTASIQVTPQGRLCPLSLPSAPSGALTAPVNCFPPVAGPPPPGGGGGFC